MQASSLLRRLCTRRAARLQLRRKPLQPRLLLLLRLQHLGWHRWGRRMTFNIWPCTSNTQQSNKAPQPQTALHTLTLKLVKPSHLDASSWRPPKKRPFMMRTHSSAASCTRREESGLGFFCKTPDVLVTPSTGQHAPGW